MADKHQSTLITSENPKSPVSEAYRVLRTNIQYSGIDKPLKTIVVTSSIPVEGKTTTVANLAVTFAQTGSRVLLIDADLRKPKVHKFFNISSYKGLTNYLAIRDDYTNYIYKSSVANLDIMPSGVIPPNPSELLNSNSMKDFIKQVRQDYDMVLLDSPPIVSVTDAAIISTIVDATILVVAAGKVEIKALVRAKELLSKVNANIIGVVMNKLNKKERDYYYSKYAYYDQNIPESPLDEHFSKQSGK
jgi:protein-tyrosine kinase